MSRLNARYLAYLTERRVRQRDAVIQRAGRQIGRWARSVHERLLGIVHADQGGSEGVRGSVDAYLLGVPLDAAELLYRELADIWQWSWDSAVANVIRAVPMEVWVWRMAPLLAREGVQQVQEITLGGEVEVEKILDGTATEAEAWEIVRRTEFPPPTAQRVNEILRATNAPDGLDAMTRIKTVLPQDLDNLRSVIIGAMSDPDRASAVQGLMPQIKELVGGVNYKAQRIARTEGMRIAEAGQKECDSQIDDLITGYRTMTANDARVRPEHQVWHGAVYKRIGQGRYWHDTLHELPTFPAGPNCRCWSVPVLSSELTAGLPPMNLGKAYAAGLARFKIQQAGLAARKAARKAAQVKQKAVPEPGRLRSQVLEKRNAEIAQKEVEHGYVIDADGKELLHKIGGKREIRFTQNELEQLKGATLTHNHPVVIEKSGAVIRDLPLSGVDGGVLVTHELEEIQAVTERYVYSLRVKQGVNIAGRGPAWLQGRKIAVSWRKQVDQNAKDQITRLLPDVKSGKMTREQLLIRMQESQYLHGHRAWEQIADQFGLEYKRLPRP